MKTECINAIVKEVQNIVGTDKKVVFQQVLKNNGLVLHGISIFECNCKESISPTLYLENYVGKDDKSIEISLVARKIVDDYNEYLRTEIPTFAKKLDVNSLLDFEKVKEKITFRLLNFDRNREMLKDVTHLKFLDLVIIFQIEIDKDYSVKLVNEIFESYGISKNELFEIAKENTKRIYPIVSMPMNEVIASYVNSEFWLITGKKNPWGASVLLYEDAFIDVSERVGEDIYILPSSTEEVLAIPVSVVSVDYLLNMVKDINENVLDDDIFLSNQVYCYNRATRKVVIANDRRFRVVS